jgi:hypothetical protein
MADSSCLVFSHFLCSFTQKRTILSFVLGRSFSALFVFVSRLAVSLTQLKTREKEEVIFFDDTLHLPNHSTMFSHLPSSFNLSLFFPTARLKNSKH